jgi:hypothetical protein
MKNEQLVCKKNIKKKKILQWSDVGSTAANVLALFSKQTESFHPPCWIGCLAASH